MLYKSVVLLALIYLYCDLFECVNIDRYDVHRILLKPNNRGHYKKTLLRSPYSPYLTIHNQRWKPYKINENVSTIVTHRHHGKKKDHNRFKNQKHSRIKPETRTRGSVHNSQYNLYNKPQIKFLNPNNIPITNYFEFRRFKDILNYYNAKEEEEYRKRIRNAKQQENKHAFFNTIKEPLSEEATSNDYAWEPPDSNEFRVTWTPISENKRPRSNSAKRIKNGFGKQYENFAHTVVLTTSKPEMLPAVIVEKDEVGGIYPIKDSNEFLQDNSHTSYEISEDSNTLSPIVKNFQNISYSTLWNQDTNDTKRSKLATFKKII